MKQTFLFFILLIITVSVCGLEYTWTGAANDHAWSNPQNWNIMPFITFPNLDDDVIIPVRTSYNYPHLNTESISCANLYLAAGAMLFLEANGFLLVYENADIYGQLTMPSSTFFSNLTVNGNLNWQSGSTAYLPTSFNSITCQSQMQFMAGSDVQITGGTVFFSSHLHNCYLINQSANTSLFRIRAEMTAPYELMISSASTEDPVISHVVNVEGSTLGCNYNGNVILLGSLLDANLPGTDYGVFFEQGNLIMDGTEQTITLPNPSSYLNNLTCSLSNTLHLGANLTLEGDLNIVSGVFDPEEYDIALGGNWSSFVGSTGFVQTGTTVTFNGTGNSHIYADENFHIVVLSKTGAGTLIIDEDCVLDCDSYDWVSGALTVNGGLFYANDMVDDAILGIVTLNSGSLVLAQDITQYLDLRGSLTINGGEMHLWGGQTNENTYFPYGGNGSFVMSSGVLHRHGYGIYISNDESALQ